MDNRRTTRRRTIRAVEDVSAGAAAAASAALGKRGSAIPVSSASAARSSPALSSAASSRSSPARRASPSRRASPARKPRTSPVRRSSRPRSTVLGASASSETITLAASTVTPPSPIAEVKEPAVKRSPKSSRNNLPTTLTTNTSSRAPHNKLQTTASVHSSYSSSTQQTIEIRSTSSASINAAAGELSHKLGEYLRRSLSKSKLLTRSTADNSQHQRRRDGTHTPTTNTEVESRDSRSMSRSIYGDDAEFSDNNNEFNARGDGIEEEDETPSAAAEEEDHFKSFNVTSTSQASIASGALSTSCRQLQVPREFGGFWGALLLMLLAPPLVYYLQWTCDATTTNTNDCRWSPWNLKALADWKPLIGYLFQSHVVACFLTFQFAVFVLSVVMPGRAVRLPAAIGGSAGGALAYKFNAFGMSLLLVVAFCIAELQNYRVAQFVLDNYLRFCLYGFVNAFVVALWCHIRADLLKSYGSVPRATPNIYAKSESFCIDFALGRHINPKWLNLVEFKLVFYRVSLLSTLLVALSCIWLLLEVPSGLSVQHIDLHAVYAHVSTHLRAAPVAFLAALLLLIYISDAITFEFHLATSFELQGEGFGCLLLLRYAATPFLLGGVAKYLLATAPHAPLSCCMAAYTAYALLAAGWFLKRGACAVKYKYRMQPSHPRFNAVESIHTFQGRRLLLGKLWGRLRQPNYAGDMLALCSLAVPLGLHFAWPPLVGLLLLVALLLHRTRRVHARNMARYHSSWVRYTSRVPYYVLPKVY